MSKLSFRAKPLDASKPMPIFMAEDLPDLPDYSAINRAVPQMPSGMTKEEESEHHLQRAMCTGVIIPTPEVTDLTDVEAYEKIYPADYKLPRQLIHMQPFAMEQDIPDYDMDSEDEKWVGIQSKKMDLTPLQFEEMMDRLEKNSAQKTVSLQEAKALLKEDDDLIIAVFDYWLDKRLKNPQHPLLLTVKTDNRLGSAANNPYLAFRRITEKMQTRKNRKNDETSYEKMLKLRRDLSKAVTLLELVKRREKTKREHLHLTIEVFEKRYQAEDFSGQILAEVSALKTTRPAFAPLFTNQFGVHQNWSNKVCNKDDGLQRKEKRQYKKRKHKLDGRSGLDDSVLRSGSACGVGGSNRNSRTGVLGSGLDPLVSSDEDNPFPHTQLSMSKERDDDTADEGPFAFRRNRYCNYLPPVSGGYGNWPWCSKSEGGIADKKYRFALTSISKPTPRCIGLARRRYGRGGRVILDRYPSDIDDIWSSLDFTIHESSQNDDSITTASPTTISSVKKEWLHFRPKTPLGTDANQNDESTADWSTSSNSSSEESESEMDNFYIGSSTRTKKPASSLYPFPTEATSICVDIEPDRPSTDEFFTAEFNIADYFTIDDDTLTGFDLGVLTTSSATSSSTTISSSSSSSSSLLLSSSSPATLPPSLMSEELGSSRFQVTPINNNVLSCRNQCHSVGKSVNNLSVSATTITTTTTTTTTTSTTTITTPPVTTSTITPLTTSTITSTSSLSSSSSLSSTQSLLSSSSSSSLSLSSSSSASLSSLSSTSNVQSFSSPLTTISTSLVTQSESGITKNVNHYRQLINNQLPSLPSSSSTSSTSLSTTSSSILSKSLTSPTRNLRVTSVTNYGNGHQNGPNSHIINSNSVVSGSTAVLQNNTGTYVSNNILPQKHSAPSGLLPGFIAQTKLANLARQQQQQQLQQQQLQQQQQGQIQQQIPTSGEITLNSNNSEGLSMEVDGVEGTPCESKQQQQQQIVRTNKNNSLAMEVT